MALTPYTAQCPNCDSEIDLTAGEMALADGDIICGNCNNQFHAPNFLLKGFYGSNKVDNSTTVDAEDIMKSSDFEIAPGYRSYRRKKFIKSILALIFNLLLLSFLVLQLLWINFDRWAAKENLRPIYGFMCSIEQLNCILPAFVELVDIKVEKFEANLHENDNIYVLQATLTNYASSYKEFPWLEIIFSDINNYPIASGKFSPYQYLASDEAAQQMPPGKPFRILLEVKKPSTPVARYDMNVIAAN